MSDTFLFFIDESGDPAARPPSPMVNFILGGVLIESHKWRQCARHVERVKAKHSIAPLVEVKWRHVFMPPLAKNPLGNLSEVERRAFVLDLLDVVNSLDLRIIAAVIDKPAAYRKRYISRPNDVFHHAEMLILERFQHFLRAKRAEGLLIQDTRGARQDDRLRRFASALIAGGSYYTKFNNLIETVLCTPSHLSVGVQIADFVIGALFREVEKGDKTFFHGSALLRKVTGRWQKKSRDGLKFWP